MELSPLHTQATHPHAKALKTEEAGARPQGSTGGQGHFRGSHGAYQHMLPILHEENVSLVNNQQLNG